MILAKMVWESDKAMRGDDLRNVAWTRTAHRKVGFFWAKSI